MQDLNDKITGSTLTAAEWNEVPSEIQNVIQGLGITLSAGDLNQLGKAIAGYVANGTFYTDSGAADAYVLSVIGSKQNPTAYTNGLEAEFIVGNTNTGASTINVAGLGVVDITGTASAGALTAGDTVRLLFNLATGDFDIVNNTGAVFPDASETVKGIAELATQAETDAGNDDARIVTPKKLRFGFSTLFAINGFIVFPSWLGGLIIQWGFDDFGTSGSGLIPLPITFPNALLAASAVDNLGVNVQGIDISASTTSNLAVSSTATIDLAHYIVIGH